MAISLIPFLMLVATLLGVLGAIVFALVYAIANKRLGVALAVGALLLPIAALIGISVLVAYMRTASYTPHTTGPTLLSPTLINGADVPPFPPQPPQLDSINQLSVDPDVWVYVVLIAFFIAGAFALIRWMSNRQREVAPCQRRGGWIIFAGVTLSIVLPLMFLSFLKSKTQQHANYSRQQAAIEMSNLAQQMHARIKVDPKAQEVLNEVAQQHGGLNHQSMQEAWERLN